MAQYYAVWVGRKPGVYDNWNQCKAQIDRFKGARYRKLKSTDYDQAVIEFNQENNNLISTTSTNNTENVPEENILTVDGASNGHNCEFQAVLYPSKEKVFSSKTYSGGTNNIAEFLGLVWGIKYLKENNLPLKIYSDSVTAMAWFRNKKANTTAHTTGKATQELSLLIKEAEEFLLNNDLSKAKIMKWDTRNWGEIAADYDRK